MKTWGVKVLKTIFCTSDVTVEAEDWDGATKAAFLLAEKKNLWATSSHYNAREVIQLGEPWAYSSGWYDMHGPDDLIVITRATGNFFTKDDISLLRNRIETLGFSIYDSWNGEGSATVSFKCRGRANDAPFKKKQLETLLAPR